HEATFVDIMQQRVVELSQGVVVRDEVGGGYGETASIPVADLSEEGVQVLRTTEAVVRAALAPEEGGEPDPDAEAAEAAAIPIPPPGMQAPEAAAPGAPAPDTGSPLQPSSASADPLDELLGAETPHEASVFEEPHPFGEDDSEIDDDDDTVRAGGP